MCWQLHQPFANIVQLISMRTKVSFSDPTSIHDLNHNTDHTVMQQKNDTEKNVNACLTLNKDRKSILCNSLKQNAKQMYKVMAGPKLILSIYTLLNVWHIKCNFRTRHKPWRSQTGLSRNESTLIKIFYLLNLKTNQQ